MATTKKLQRQKKATPTPKKTISPKVELDYTPIVGDTVIYLDPNGNKHKAQVIMVHCNNSIDLVLLSDAPTTVSNVSKENWSKK